MEPTNLKKQKWLWLGCAAAYLLLLYLLTLAERGSPDASIRTVADAFWYSLVTLSTVGYGDLYPVTMAGRILGVIFILLSLGLLTFLLGVLIRIITGSVLPNLQLWRVRKKTWYIFSCRNSAAFALAKDLAEQEPDCVLLFPAGSGDAPPERLPYLVYGDSPESVAGRKKDHCSICFMDDADTYERAVAALRTGHQVYCRTEFAPDVCPQNLTLFNPYDCCAQCYWQEHGLRSDEHTVLLVGDGKYAENLLTQGLLLNVYAQERTVSYHVFGDWDAYLRNHHQLQQTLSLDGSNPNGDRLYIHRTPWNADSSLLAAADRIILCRDVQEENIELLGQIRRFFAVTGRIHLLCRSPLPGEVVFGAENSIYTTRFVLQAQLSWAARTMHRIYCDASGGTAPGWEELSEFQRQSNIAAARHLLTKIRILLKDDTLSGITPENCRAAYACYQNCGPEQKEICRRIEHQRWMRFYSMYNWRYGSVRDNVNREHPLMLPYEELSSGDQAKDDYAWELLNQLAYRLGK